MEIVEKIDKFLNERNLTTKGLRELRVGDRVELTHMKSPGTVVRINGEQVEWKADYGSGSGTNSGNYFSHYSLLRKMP